MLLGSLFLDNSVLTTDDFMSDRGNQCQAGRGAL